MQRLQRVEVRRDILAHGGVRASAGFDGENTRGWQRGVAGEELGVFSDLDQADVSFNGKFQDYLEIPRLTES